MKVAVLFATFCCASAFGLHGVATNSPVKKVGFAGNHKSMVQAVDIHGNRMSNMVSPDLFES